MYFELFHGRNAVDEELDDWGFGGPIIPIEMAHFTYNTSIRLKLCGEFYFVPTVEDMIFFDGKYYGDWAVLTDFDAGLFEDFESRRMSAERAVEILEAAERAEMDTQKIVSEMKPGESRIISAPGASPIIEIVKREIPQDEVEESQPKFLVDIPSSFSNEWEFVGGFATMEEAVKFCREHFGADDDGRVSLITEVS